jgi:hypothetical protein
MNQTFTNTKNELTFTKNYTSITASTKLTAIQKLLIARVLNWQQNKLVCTLSNNALAAELGESLSTIKRTITKLNKTTFFVSKETSHFNEFGSWSNSKEIVIDEKKLFEFISTDSKVIQPETVPEPIKVVNQPETIPEIIPIEVEINNAAEAMISTSNIIDYQEDIIVPQIDCDGVILSERTSESITELIDLFNGNDYIMLSSIEYPVISIFKGKTNTITDKISKEINSKAKEFQDGTLDIKEYIFNKIKEVA